MKTFMFFLTLLVKIFILTLLLNISTAYVGSLVTMLVLYVFFLVMDMDKGEEEEKLKYDKRRHSNCFELA